MPAEVSSFLRFVAVTRETFGAVMSVPPNIQFTIGRVMMMDVKIYNSDAASLVGAHADQKDREAVIAAAFAPSPGAGPNGGPSPPHPPPGGPGVEETTPGNHSKASNQPHGNPPGSGNGDKLGPETVHPILPSASPSKTAKLGLGSSILRERGDSDNGHPQKKLRILNHHGNPYVDVDLVAGTSVLDSKDTGISVSKSSMSANEAKEVVAERGVDATPNLAAHPEVHPDDQETICSPSERMSQMSDNEESNVDEDEDDASGPESRPSPRHPMEIIGVPCRTWTPGYTDGQTMENDIKDLDDFTLSEQRRYLCRWYGRKGDDEIPYPEERVRPALMRSRRMQLPLLYLSTFSYCMILCDML